MILEATLEVENMKIYITDCQLKFNQLRFISFLEAPIL